MLNRELRRGEVYYANLPEKENSRIQGGYRPIVIFSNDKNNTYSSIVHYVPLTATIKKVNLPVHIKVEVNFLPKSSIALCEQLDLEDKENVLKYIDWEKGCIGKLNECDMKHIGYGVAIHFELIPVVRHNTNQTKYAIA
jgi:mRNA-degrading endonuclease toxin of MazEF toxin-antitoxin module